MLVTAAPVLLALLALQTPVDWPAYGHDPQGTRYSPAAAIDRGNVARLEPAWTYRTGETGAAFKTTKPTAFEATPLVVDGVMYVGTPLGRAIARGPASGEVRAYDARTGALKWTWDPIPQGSGDPAYGEWGGALAHKTGAANAWSVLAADPAHDLVFIPTGSAAPDYYGVLRLGRNRYANSIVALHASTGKLVWAFQTVHHDLWDYDNASPPALVTVTHGGASVPAVLQATKTGMLFVLDRQTGRPIFPVEERSVPPSDIPGERPSATQPVTTLTPPLSPHRYSPEDIWGPTPEAKAACRAVAEGLRNEG